MTASAIWLALGAGVVGLIVVTLLFRAKAASSDRDLGTVSDHWVAEHGAGQDHGPSR